MTVDVVVDRLIDAMLVIGIALVFCAGFDVPRAHEENADFVPNVHLGFGPQVLKRDLHSVVPDELFPPIFPPGEYRPPRSPRKSRRGSLPVKAYRPRGTLDATQHPDVLIGVPSVHLDGKGWRLHWEKRGRELPRNTQGVPLGYGAGLEPRRVRMWKGKEQEQK